MAYRRRRGGRRRGGHKGGWMHKAGQGISLASRAFKLAKFVASIVNVEYKHLDSTVYTGSSIPTTGAISLLTGITQGDTSSTRNGNSVKGKSISLKFESTCGTAITTQRFILFLDKNSNGVIPTATELLVSDHYLSPYNDDNMGSRFIVLDDKRIAMGFNDTTNHYSAGATTKDFSFFHKLNGHIKFDGTTAAIADCVSGHLYLYAVASGNNTSFTSCRSRLLYIDN